MPVLDEVDRQLKSNERAASELKTQRMSLIKVREKLLILSGAPPKRASVKDM